MGGLLGGGRGFRMAITNWKRREGVCCFVSFNGAASFPPFSPPLPLSPPPHAGVPVSSYPLLSLLVEGLLQLAFFFFPMWSPRPQGTTEREAFQGMPVLFFKGLSIIYFLFYCPVLLYSSKLFPCCKLQFFFLKKGYFSYNFTPFRIKKNRPVLKISFSSFERFEISTWWCEFFELASFCHCSIPLSLWAWLN